MAKPWTVYSRWAKEPALHSIVLHLDFTQRFIDHKIANVREFCLSIDSDSLTVWIQPVMTFCFSRFRFPPYSNYARRRFAQVPKTCRSRPQQFRVPVRWIQDDNFEGLKGSISVGARTHGSAFMQSHACTITSTPNNCACFPHSTVLHFTPRRTKIANKIASIYCVFFHAHFDHCMASAKFSYEHALFTDHEYVISRRTKRRQFQ